MDFGININISSKYNFLNLHYKDPSFELPNVISLHISDKNVV